MGLGEDTAQFHLPGACRLPLDTARTPFQFRAHHGHLCSIHFDVQYGHLSTQDRRQVQLNGALDLALFPLCDIGSDRLGMTFDGFGGHL